MTYDDDRILLVGGVWFLAVLVSGLLAWLVLIASAFGIVHWLKGLWQ